MTKSGKIGVKINKLQVVTKCGQKTTSFYVRFRVWLMVAKLELGLTTYKWCRNVVEADSFFVRFRVWLKVVKLELRLTTYKWCPNVVETDSFYVRFRVWLKVVKL